MARQKGHVKYQGTIGDIRHFKIKGMDGYFAGLKGGPTANQIKTAPEFERTRENMSEFGGCAHVAKVLRSGLGRELSKFTDPSFTGRLTALMKTVNLKDTTGVRGKRAINVSLHKASLKNIVFKKGISFESICNLSVFFTSEGGIVSVSLKKSLNATEELKAPQNATHFRLCFNAVSLPDYRYNNETKAYEPMVAADSGSNGVVYSEYTPVTTANFDFEHVYSTGSFSYDAGPNKTAILAVGIEFFVANNSTYLPLSGGAMKIMGVL